MKNWKRIFKLLLILFLIWFIGHTVFITVDGLSDNGKNADVAVILGNKVNQDGTLSERLKKRLECGLGLYQNHRVKKIIVSGGFGKEGFYEGNKMRDFLVANKVPDSLIIVDNFGNNTRATVENTMKLKDSLHFKSIIVVSQYFHVTRTKMLFKKRGFQNVSSVSPNYFEIKDVYSIIREFAGYYTQ
jgi:vancomycin permeability regulator SanA